MPTAAHTHRRWMAWTTLAGAVAFGVASVEWKPGEWRMAVVFAALHAVQYVAQAAGGNGIDPGPQQPADGPSAAPLDGGRPPA